MSKKNRAKSKAKRFGEGSAKPIVSAATYGVGGNAFAQAIADPVSTVHSNKPELLVVDGYNVIHCTPRYEKLVYDHSDDPYSSDVHDMARTALINDVAAFAQGRYEAVIVFDGAGNISSERPNLPARGVRIEFSPTASLPTPWCRSSASRHVRRAARAPWYRATAQSRPSLWAKVLRASRAACWWTRSSRSITTFTRQRKLRRSR